MAASILFSAAFCRSIIVVMRSTPASCVAGPPVCDRAFQGNEERWQHNARERLFRNLLRCKRQLARNMSEHVRSELWALNEPWPAESLSIDDYITFLCVGLPPTVF